MWQRWNQTTHIFEKSDNDGTTWVPLPLNASIINEGTVNASRLPTTIAYTNTTNQFTFAQRISNAGGNIPRVTFTDVTAAAGIKNYEINYVGGNLNFWGLNDIESAVLSNIYMDRSSNLKIAARYYERARNVALGDWTTVPNAFSVNTGTISVGSVYVNAISLIGSTLIWNVYIQANFGGSPTVVQCTIPGGYTAALHYIGSCTWLNANTAASAVGATEIGAGSTTLQMKRDLAGTAWLPNSYYLGFSAAFAIVT